MKVNLSISKRVDAQGHSEILLLIRRRLNGKVVDIRAKSGIFIDPKMFDEKRKIVKTFAANKLITDEVRYHNEQLRKLNTLINRINDAYNSEPNKDRVQGRWLQDIVCNKKRQTDARDKDIYELFYAFLGSKKRPASTITHLSSCINSVKRFEQYTRETQRKGYVFDIDTINQDDIKKYANYITHEKELSDEYPHIFSKILINCKYKKIRAKGSNSVCKMLQNLKSFFLWLNREEITYNMPFEHIEIGVEKYGTPYYLSIEERDIIASSEMPTIELESQRDIFIFQCLTGCRANDLMMLTSANITKDNILIYTPHKTINKGMQAMQVRVPLHPKAIELIGKYKNIDKKGRIFPFVPLQKYNSLIKEIFKISGITRMVEVRNTHTGEMESCHINKIASSHLARRTFVGNLYLKVADPNIIGKMSGHVDGSKAFARYRKIEDELLRNVIDML